MKKREFSQVSDGKKLVVYTNPSCVRWLSGRCEHNATWSEKNGDWHK
jgi:hypothetical protein